MLHRCLRGVLDQSVPVAIIVLDDGSTDGTESMVRREFPQVKFYREAKAQGPTFQRNKGASLTSADVIFTIDDDCILKSPDICAHTLKLFDHSRIAAVTLPFVNVLQGTAVQGIARCETDLEVTFDYYGGMIAFRRSAYLGVGGYHSFLFMHVEEGDLAIRLLNAGYVLRLGSARALEHMESPVRDRPALHLRGPRNHVLYAFYNVPWPNLPVHLASTTVNCFGHGLRVGHPFWALRGLLQGYCGMWHERRQRHPVSRRVYKLSRMLRGAGSLPFDQVETLLPPMKDFTPTDLHLERSGSHLG